MGRFVLVVITLVVALFANQGYGSPAYNPTTLCGLNHTPEQLKSAWNLPQSMDAGKGKTIAIVSYNIDDHLESDLNAFSTKYGLPQCTTANGCFRIMNQTGGTDMGKTVYNSRLETHMDIQWAHAMAPGAKIIYVPPSVNSFLPALRQAAKVADIVSLSYTWQVTDNGHDADYIKVNNVTYFINPNVTFVIAGRETCPPPNVGNYSPANNVIFVGGTLFPWDGTYRHVVEERAWGGSCGGCAPFPAPPAQKAIAQQFCNGNRALPDVAMVAQCIFVAQTDEDDNNTLKWPTSGGTSLSAPLFAGRIAMENRTKPFTLDDIYGGSLNFKDIRYGKGSYGQFNATEGYDHVTGMGVWVGPVGTPQIPALTTGYVSPNLITEGSCETGYINYMWDNSDVWSWFCSGASATYTTGDDFYFNAGDLQNSRRDSTLVQTVDVSAYSSVIDTGRAQFNFSTLFRNYNQNPVDLGGVILEYQDINGFVLSTYNYSRVSSRYNWITISDIRVAPAQTRKIEVQLWCWLAATVADTAECSAYYDNVALNLEVVA